MAEIHPTDRHVGARLRLRRKQTDTSQEALAAALGVTFQQVQKYEKGTNRISASRLHQAARVLRTTPGWFFDGLEEPEGATPVLAHETAADAAREMVFAPGGYEMARAWPGLKPEHRKNLLNLAQCLTTADLTAA